MTMALFDARACKRTVNLTVNSDLYAKAKAAGINASRVAEAALADALRERMAAALREDIRRDRDALAAYVAAHGDPAAELRALYGDPMQHDVFANPAPRTRRAFPFIAVLQADLAGEGRGAACPDVARPGTGCFTVAPTCCSNPRMFGQMKRTMITKTPAGASRVRAC